MHHFIDDYAAVAATGLQTVVFFHSPEDKLASSRTEPVPFHLVADPEKIAFRSYAVGTGARGLFSPTVMRDYVSALRSGYPSGMFTSDGGILGNPADFMVGPEGTLLDAHYGVQYADSLTAAAAVAVFEGLRNNRAA